MLKCVYSSICNRHKAERAARRHWNSNVKSKFMFCSALRWRKCKKLDSSSNRSPNEEKKERTNCYVTTFLFIYVHSHSSLHRFDGAAFFFFLHSLSLYPMLQQIFFRAFMWNVYEHIYIFFSLLLWAAASNTTEKKCSYKNILAHFLQFFFSVPVGHTIYI